MLKFYIKYRNEAEQQCFPVFGDDFGIRVEETEYRHNYRSFLTGTLQFQKDDFDYIDGFHSFTGLFTLRVVRGEMEHYYRFRKFDLSFNDQDKIATLEINNDEDNSEFSEVLNEKVSVIAAGTPRTMVEAALKPMVQIYFAGSANITCFLDRQYWQQEVKNVYFSDSMIKGLGFSDAKQYFWISTNDKPLMEECGVVWKRDGFELHDSSNAFKIVRHLEELGQGEWIERLEFRRIIGNDLLYVTGYDPSDGPEGFGRLQDPMSEEFYDAQDMGSGKFVMLDSRRVYVRLVANFFRTHTAEQVELPEDDVMPSSTFRFAIPGMGLETGLHISTNYGFESWYGVRPWWNKRFNPIPWGEHIYPDLGLPTYLYYPGQPNVPPGQGFMLVPVNPSEWTGIISIWYTDPPENAAVYNSGQNLRIQRAQSFLMRDVFNAIVRELGLDLNYDYNKCMFGQEWFNRIFFTPASNVSVWLHSSPATVMEVSLNDIFEFFRVTFNAVLFFEGKDFYFKTLPEAYPDGPTINLDALRARRIGRVLSYGLKTRNFPDVELKRGLNIIPNQEVGDFFQASGIEYDLDNPDLHNKPQHEENVGFYVDLAYAYTNPDSFDESGIFILDVLPPHISRRVVTRTWYYNMHELKALNGMFSLLSTLDSTDWNRDLLLSSRRINQRARTGTVDFNMGVEMDFPITEEQANDIEKIRVLCSYGVGFIKEIFLNLNSMYVSGTFKFRHRTQN